MAKRQVRTRLSSRANEAFEEYAKSEGEGEYRSAEKLIEEGLKSYGYLKGASRLQSACREGVRFGAYSAAVVVGLHLTTPLNLSAAVIALLAAALFMALVDRAEPAITEQAANLRRRPAATDGGEPE